MPEYYDMVLDDNDMRIFSGNSDDVVKWLEENMGDRTLWVYIGASKYIITASEYLDLAS